MYLFEPFEELLAKLLQETIVLLSDEERYLFQFEPNIVFDVDLKPVHMHGVLGESFEVKEIVCYLEAIGPDRDEYESVLGLLRAAAQAYAAKRFEEMENDQRSFLRTYGKLTSHHDDLPSIEAAFGSFVIDKKAW